MTATAIKHLRGWRSYWALSRRIEHEGGRPGILAVWADEGRKAERDRPKRDRETRWHQRCLGVVSVSVSNRTEDGAWTQRTLIRAPSPEQAVRIYGMFWPADAESHGPGRDFQRSAWCAGKRRGGTWLIVQSGGLDI